VTIDERAAVDEIRATIGAVRDALALGDDDRPDPDAAIREVEGLACTALARLGATYAPAVVREVAGDVFELMRSAVRSRRRSAMPIGES
jgi:hypothetical protein